MNTYQQTYTISVSDMDISYRITPNAILQYFQDTFARFLATRNIAAFDILKQNLIWVITDFEMRFTKELPLWSSEVTMKVQINEISIVRVSLGYQFFDSVGEVFAEGTSVWAILSLETRRPYPARDLMLNAGCSETGVVPKKNLLPKVTEDHFLEEISHQVNITDLDFNGHVSNRTYLAIAMGTLSPEFTLANAPRYMHIKFKKESFFGQTLKCRISKEGDIRFWYDIRNEEGVELCNVYAEWEKHRPDYVADVSGLVARK